MDIVQRNTKDGKFNLANALVDIDNRLKGLEEAMAFFSSWYNETQRVNILVPEHLANDNNNKLIL
jgi:hypothetical protein